MATPQKILRPQSALEEAAVEAIRVAGPPQGFQGGYDGPNADLLCRRMYDGRPAPLAGPYFVSVWSDNARQSQSRTSLDQIFRFYVTVTVRCPARPWDRMLDWRDELAARVDQIEALLHADTLDYRITRRAMQLAGLTWLQSNTKQRIGWVEAFCSEGLDPIQDVGPAWFHANPQGSGAPEVGIAQRIRFGKSRRIQALATEG